MITQLIFLILMMGILFAGTSLRHYAVEVCNDCNCRSENCCKEQEKEE